jgi:putative Mn2+ efflux pump MntP
VGISLSQTVAEECGPLLIDGVAKGGTVTGVGHHTAAEATAMIFGACVHRNRTSAMAVLAGTLGAFTVLEPLSGPATSIMYTTSYASRW